jgi:hypothetical protein
VISDTSALVELMVLPLMVLTASSILSVTSTSMISGLAAQDRFDVDDRKITLEIGHADGGDSSPRRRRRGP